MSELPIDLGQQGSWPIGVRALVDELAATARRWPEGQSGRSACDLAIADARFRETAERRVRDALSGDLILAYQATRLLPHEVDDIRDTGLLPLSEDLRRRKVYRAAANYPQLISSGESEWMLASGPLTCQHGTADVRLGVICVVAPICAFIWDAGGLEPLLAQWGGESIYWQDGPAPALERLTAVSVPSIIEVAIPSEVMHGSGLLWPVMVGAVLELESPWREWHVRCSVPPASVIDIIQPGGERWPSGLSCA